MDKYTKMFKEVWKLETETTDRMTLFIIEGRNGEGKIALTENEIRGLVKTLVEEYGHRLA